MALVGTFLYPIPYGPSIPLEGLPFAPPQIPDQIVEIPGAYAKVTSLSGGKDEMNAILSVYVEGPDPDAPEVAEPAQEESEGESESQGQTHLVLREVHSFSLRFVPELGSDNFLRQAYLHFAQHPKCATLVSDE